MILFCCDLDNTLIYSYKQNIGTIPVELYENRQISFMTEFSHKALKQVIDLVNFVPTTTRSLAQYQRIDLKIPTPPYALVANGGILLLNGKIDEAWYKESLSRVTHCASTMEEAFSLLQQNEFVIKENFETRWVDNLFLFTKSSNPQATIASLSKKLNTKQVNLHTNGTKVYILPNNLTKGDGLCRLKEKLNQTKITLAAGDSTFDLPMLQAAEHPFAPCSLISEKDINTNWSIAEENTLFSDFLLKEILKNYK